MFEPDKDGVFARVTVSPARRFMQVAVLFALGVLVLGMAYNSPSGVVSRVVLFAMGIGILIYGERCRRTTDDEILLTDAGLTQKDGTVIAPSEQFVSVDRGVFAFKPSNGFTLILKEKQPRAWSPGLWWRVGRRVGIGGVASAGAAKFMAEQIALRLAAKAD